MRKKQEGRLEALSEAVTKRTGTTGAFILAFGVVLVWALMGPLFNYSSTWQLVINTGTTIVTFLMVFLIQNTQNRDARAIHLKLDELIHGVKGARNFMVDLDGNLTTSTGEKLQGWTTLNSSGTVDTNSTLGGVVVPVGTLKAPTPTVNMSVDLNLNAAAAAADGVDGGARRSQRGGMVAVRYPVFLATTALSGDRMDLSRGL